MWGEIFSIKPGSVIIFFKNQPYVSYMPGSSYQAINIVFSSHESDRILRDESAPGNLRQYYEGVAGNSVRELFNQVRRYKQESFYGDERGDYQASQSLTLLLCELEKLEESIPEQKIGLQVLISRIRMNPSQTTSLEEAAEECGLSLSTFKRHFSLQFGRTFRQYQLEEKVEQACLILSQENRAPLKWIAGQLGFCDEYYFSRVFKQIKRISPGRYRDMILKGV